MMRLKIKKLLMTLFILYALDFFGIFDHLFEKNYYSEFKYPLQGDIPSLVREFRGESNASLPLLLNSHGSYSFLRIPKKDKCDGDSGIRLVYVVKSAIQNVRRREVIRKTWGYEKRFADVSIRTVFTLGSGSDHNEAVLGESRRYGDIVLGDFVDSYFNNTMKTLMSLKWAAVNCKKARFFFFVDDDYYVSTRNALRFLRNPLNYPMYLEDELSATISFEEDSRPAQRRNLQQLIEYDIPSDVKLFSGYVFPSSSPQRHRMSRWYISLQEYPYHRWPPYVTGGCIVLSREALLDFYAGSHFVEPFRFDDIYLGILSAKLGISPFHSGEFYFDRKYFGRPGDYTYVVASHGFSDPDELLSFWSKQKEYGNA